METLEEEDGEGNYLKVLLFIGPLNGVENFSFLEMNGFEVIGHEGEGLFEFVLYLEFPLGADVKSTEDIFDEVEGCHFGHIVLLFLGDSLIGFKSEEFFGV